MTQEQIEQELKIIQERNRRVEAEKAWEVSAFRRSVILSMTYVIAGVALVAIGNDHPWRNALVPTLGFFLSTLSIPALKRFWVSRYKQ